MTIIITIISTIAEREEEGGGERERGVENRLRE